MARVCHLNSCIFFCYPPICNHTLKLLLEKEGRFHLKPFSWVRIGLDQQKRYQRNGDWCACALLSYDMLIQQAKWFTSGFNCHHNRYLRKKQKHQPFFTMWTKDAKLLHCYCLSCVYTVLLIIKNNAECTFTQKQALLTPWLPGQNWHWFSVLTKMFTTPSFIEISLKFSMFFTDTHGYG